MYVLMYVYTDSYRGGFDENLNAKGICTKRNESNTRGLVFAALTRATQLLHDTWNAPVRRGTKGWQGCFSYFTIEDTIFSFSFYCHFF